MRQRWPGARAEGAVHGADDVSRLVTAVLSGRPDTELTIESVNGRAGPALRHAGRAVAVVAVRETDAEVGDLWIVLNPGQAGWPAPPLTPARTTTAVRARSRQRASQSR